MRARRRPPHVPASGEEAAHARELRRSDGAAAWQHASAQALLDEHPSAYKPIDVVMRDQADLVEIEHELRGVANYKGVETR
ncbi:MAG: RtcB family protein [Gaiellales bacterium]